MTSKQQRYLNFARMSIRCGEYPYSPEQEAEFQQERGLSDDEMHECRVILIRELRQKQRKECIQAVQALVSSGVQVIIDEMYASPKEPIRGIALSVDGETIIIEVDPQEEGRKRSYLLPFPITFKVKTDMLK